GQKNEALTRNVLLRGPHSPGPPNRGRERSLDPVPESNTNRRGTFRFLRHAGSPMNTLAAPRKFQAIRDPCCRANQLFRRWRTRRVSAATRFYNPCYESSCSLSNILDVRKRTLTLRSRVDRAKIPRTMESCPLWQRRDASGS